MLVAQLPRSQAPSLLLELDNLAGDAEVLRLGSRDPGHADPVSYYQVGALKPYRRPAVLRNLLAHVRLRRVAEGQQARRDQHQKTAKKPAHTRARGLLDDDLLRP